MLSTVAGDDEHHADADATSSSTSSSFMSEMAAEEDYFRAQRLQRQQRENAHIAENDTDATDGSSNSSSMLMNFTVTRHVAASWLLHTCAPMFRRLLTLPVVACSSCMQTATDSSATDAS